MGLLDNWLNKKKKEQLEKAGGKTKEKSAKENGDSEDGKKLKAAAKPAEKAEKEKTAKGKLPQGSKADKILVKPLVTEKSAIAESGNKYSFKVARDANKLQIKKAIQDLYGVMPSRVNVLNAEGRQVRFGRKTGRRSDFKKAIITLPEGKTIDIHAGV